MTSFLRPRLVAACVACLALTAPAQAQFNPFQRQPTPPADVPGGAPGALDDPAGQVVRINRLEEALRQANGRIEELQNAQRRLEALLQKFRQDVEFRLGDRSEGAPQDSDIAEAPLGQAQPGLPPRPRRSDAFDPNADPNAPGRAPPAGNYVAERAARPRYACAVGARNACSGSPAGTRQGTAGSAGGERTDRRRLRGRDA